MMSFLMGWMISEADKAIKNANTKKMDESLPLMKKMEHVAVFPVDKKPRLKLNRASRCWECSGTICGKYFATYGLTKELAYLRLQDLIKLRFLPLRFM